MSDKDPTNQAGNRQRANRDNNRRLKKSAVEVLALFKPIEPKRIIKKKDLALNAEGDFWDWDNRITITQKDIQDILDTNLETTTDEMPFNWYFSDYDEQAYRGGSFQENANISAILDNPIPDNNLLFMQSYQDGLAVIQANDYRLLQNLSRTTSVQVFGVIQNGMQAGLNRTQIRDDIIRRFEVSQSSSQRIVDTEINKAYNVARTDLNDIYTDLGINLGVMHISALLAGGRTRPEHARRHGKVFTTAEQNKWWNRKPNRINCHCSVRTVELNDDGSVKNKDRQDKVIKQGKDFFKDE